MHVPLISLSRESNSCDAYSRTDPNCKKRCIRLPETGRWQCRTTETKVSLKQDQHCLKSLKASEVCFKLPQHGLTSLKCWTHSWASGDQAEIYLRLVQHCLLKSEKSANPFRAFQHSLIDLKPGYYQTWLRHWRVDNSSIRRGILADKCSRPLAFCPKVVCRVSSCSGASDGIFRSKSENKHIFAVTGNDWLITADIYALYVHTHTEQMDSGTVVHTWLPLAMVYVTSMYLDDTLLPQVMVLYM